MKTIQVLIAPDGSSKVETRGFSGSQCREASRFLETALGQATSERLTGEYFRQSTSQSQQARQQ